ncbi:protein NYNRIN-like [Ascaphus truei]|uniref:protein NYNRIN-like n=1 Tax=Ascaphus truei TaxID=8439 RepID=UPI003F5990C3
MQYEGTLHDCHTQVQREKASPFSKEKDETAPAVFVDGARYWEDGQFWTGFAVNDPEGKKMFKFQLPPSYSAQCAELEAVKWVIENVEGKINIYSDSSYVVRALTELLPLWCKRGLVDASGKGLQHAAILEKLYQEGLDAPDRVAVLKVKAHQGISEDPIIMGNFEADIAAKDAARYGETLYPIVRIQDISSVSKGLPTIFIESVAFEGEQAKDSNIKHLRNTMSTDISLSDQEGILCKQTNTGCLLPILPAHLEPLLVKYNHDTMGHIGTDLLTKVMQDKFWSATLVQICKNVCAECLICAQTHPRPKGQKPQVQRVPIAGGPWENIQIDFIGPLPKAKGGYAYGLVVVDVFTKWPEVIPVRNCTALTTAKALWTHIFSHWGFPKVMECDNGPHFVGNITKALCGLLGIQQRFHIPYHSQSAGIVERMNRTLKTRIRKCLLDQGKDWALHIPAVLLSIRATPSQATQVSPFELMTGRKMPVWFPNEPTLSGPMIAAAARSEWLKDLQTQLQSLSQFAACNMAKPVATTANGADKFIKGGVVMIKTFPKPGPWEANWEGPYKILDKLGSTVIHVEKVSRRHSKCCKPHKGTTMWVHIDQCKLYKGRLLPLQVATDKE